MYDGNTMLMRCEKNSTAKVHLYSDICKIMNKIFYVVISSIAQIRKVILRILQNFVLISYSHLCIASYTTIASVDYPKPSVSCGIATILSVAYKGAPERRVAMTNSLSSVRLLPHHDSAHPTNNPSSHRCGAYPSVASNPCIGASEVAERLLLLHPSGKACGAQVHAVAE